MNISEANRRWQDEARARREKQEQSRNIPSRWQGAPPYYHLSCIGGNTLSSAQAGIKYLAELVTEVPSNWDPDVTFAFDDGWGNAWLWINNDKQVKRVLFLNSQNGGMDGTWVTTWQAHGASPLYLPVAGSPEIVKEVWVGMVR
jgi:hypothetical protein